MDTTRQFDAKDISNYLPWQNILGELSCGKMFSHSGKLSCCPLRNFHGSKQSCITNSPPRRTVLALGRQLTAGQFGAPEIWQSDTNYPADLGPPAYIYMSKWLIAKYFAAAGVAIFVFPSSFWTNRRSCKLGNLSVISTELMFCCHYTQTQSAYKAQIYCGRHFSGNLSSLAVGNIIKKYVFVRDVQKYRYRYRYL